MRLRVAEFTSLLGVFLLVIFSPVSAATANISKSYGYASPIMKDSLVSVDPSNPSDVIPANTNNQKELIGIAVENADSLIAINPGKDKVQVASTGSAVLLVSNINGNIQPGYQVSVSPLDGIGMKASAGSEVIGIAQKAFSPNSPNTSKKTLKQINGNNSTVYIGYIPVAIQIGQASVTQKLNAFQKIGMSLTGKTIPTYRIILSIIVAIVTFFGLLILIYASIYGSIISLGRNPLAKESIFKTLSKILAMVVVTGFVASLVVYLLLR